MRTKKIWIWAVIFGLIATASLYLALFYGNIGQTAKEKDKPSIDISSNNNSPSTASSINQAQNESTDKSSANSFLSRMITNFKKETETTEQNTEEKDDGIKEVLLPISDGKRAISVNVSEAQGVQGFIQAGNFVDLIALTPSKDEWHHDDEAQILLQNVKVLEIGHATDDEATAARYKAVTLEVTPDQGLRLALAQFDGQIYLMLRNDGDESRLPDYSHIHADQLHSGGHLLQ